MDLIRNAQIRNKILIFIGIFIFIFLFTPYILSSCWEGCSYGFSIFPVTHPISLFLVMFGDWLSTGLQLVAKFFLAFVIFKILYLRSVRTYIKISIASILIIIYAVGLSFIWKNYFVQGIAEAVNIELSELVSRKDIYLGMFLSDAQAVLDENDLDYNSCPSSDVSLDSINGSSVYLRQAGCLTIGNLSKDDSRAAINAINPIIYYDTKSFKIIY
ncbi:MAG: hypothetical protein AAB821_00630, partial [Patescibacteria group bacterium]